MRGDAIAFVQQIEHLSFPEVVRRLDVLDAPNPAAQ